MNLSIVEAFRKKFPDLEIKTPKWATLGVTEEYKRLGVGEIVLFPVDTYNYQTVRTAPNTTMVPERLEGKKWSTKLDIDNKSYAVLRVS